MLPADWAELGPLVDAALDAPLEKRVEIIGQLSGGDPRRRAELERLVAECERETPFLARPAGERFAALLDDAADAPLPEILGGRYRIEREIGRGGMARVYLAHDEKHARSVAIKVIRADLAASLGRERFLREIGIAARLRHPNIVPLFDSGDADGVLYFVMPYEEGPSLRARIGASAPLTVAERMNILRDVARALMYAHGQGVVHRDVKPDNVMLSGGAAVVTDFGIAKAVHAAQGGATATAAATLTQLGAGIGTPAYMAPEQALGNPDTDHRADIYSFGCVAYELFAGRPPFHDMPTHGIIAAHVGTMPVPIQQVSTDVPAGIAALIARCLEKDPDARPQSARELLERLEGEGTRGAPSITPRVPASARRSVLRIAIPVAAVLVVVLIAGAVRKYRTPPAPVGARQLVVLPMDNETGDPKLDYVATGILDGITRRLERSGGFQVRSGARSEWPASARNAFVPIGEEFGSKVLLRTVLARFGDSLEVRGSLLDAGTKGEKALAARRFATSQLREVESALAAAVSGAVFRVARPTEPRAPDHAIDPESYRLTLEGWHQFFNGRNVDGARELFDRATTLDPNNARAWSGLSSTWGLQTVGNGVPFETGYDRTSAAADRALKLDSLQGSAWANLAVVRALKYRNLAVGEDLLRRAKAAEPSNPEIYQVESSLYRHAWQWDKAHDAIRIAQQLDPLRSSLVSNEAGLLACQNRLLEAERLLQQELRMNPSGGGRNRLAGILARLGRYDEAISALRQDALRAGQDSIAVRLAAAHGQSGYRSFVQQRGRTRLAGLLDRGKRTWVAPFSIMLAQFEAEDTAAAYASLAKLDRARDVNLVKLRCSPEIDPERGKPRLDSVLARIPGLALR